MKILLLFCIVGIFLLRKGCPTLDACNWSFQKLVLKIWTGRKPKYQRHIISLNLNPEKNCSPSKCSRNKRYCDQNWNFFSKVNFVMKCRKLLSLFCKIDILPRGDNIEYYLSQNFLFASSGNTFSICGECQSQNDLCIDFFRTKKSRSIVKSFETKFYPRMSIFDIAYNLTDTNFNGKPHE